MGLFKKIFKPVSKVLDKIIPNEIKPALPYLAAFAPFIAPGIMGSSVLQRAAMGGGLNIFGQLAQEGNEGDINLLSAGLGALSGAMSAPGQSPTVGQGVPGADFTGADFGFEVAGNTAATGTPSAGEFFRNFSKGAEGSGVMASGQRFLGDTLAKGSDMYAAGLKEGLFSKEGLKAAALPAATATGDLMFAQNKRDQDEYDRMMEEESEADAASDAQRAFAIRRAMEAQGATEEEIEDAIYAAGYKTGGRVGFKFGGIDEAIENVTEEIETKGKEGIMQASREDPLLVEEYNKYVFDLLENRPDAKPMSFQDFKRMIMSGMKSGGRVKMEEGGEIKEGIMLVADETGEETSFGSKEYYEKEVEKRISDLNEMMNEDKMYHLSPWSIGMIEELILKANNKGVDILELTETYEKAKNSQAEWFQSLPENQQDFWKDYYQKDFDRTTDMGIFPGQEEFGGMSLKDKSQRDDKVPAPERDQFDIEGFDTLVQEAKDGGLMNLGGKEMDLRKGGFVPIGKKERADDVPARLSKNEFVMTADAVRAAGGGSVNKGAKRMYNLMNSLEAKA
jgi:hypothetical protein